MWDLSGPDKPAVSSKTVPLPQADAEVKKLISTLIISTSSKMVLQGHQLFDAHDFATPRATLEPGTIPDAVPLTMDMCEGGGFIAVATRDVRDPTRVTRKKKPATKQAVSLDSADGSDGSDDTDYSESDASTTSAEDSAYETCSNGSTDVDGASDSDGSSDTLNGEDHDSHDTASISSDSEGEPRTEARPALMRVRPGGEVGEHTIRLANDPMKQKEEERPTSGPWGPPHGHAEGVPPQQRWYIDSDFPPQTIRSNLALWLAPSIPPKTTACSVASGRKRSAFCGFRGEDIFCQNDNANQRW